MDFVLTDTSSNPWQFRSSDLSPGNACILPIGRRQVALSIEQIAPLLRSVEIPVLSSQRIYHRSDFRTLPIQYPCNLRTAVRGSLGLRVANRIDAIAACQTLFSRKVEGAFPKYLLVEEDYRRTRQLSLAMVFEQPSCGITLLGSHNQNLAVSSLSEEGADIEKICLPRNDFRAEDGQLLASRLGLGEVEGKGLTSLLEKLYLMMTWAGLTSCYLDSLALDPAGEVMVLAGECLFGVDSPLKRQAQAAMQTGTVIHPAILSHGLSHGLSHQQLAERAESESPVKPQIAAAPNKALQTQASSLAPSQRDRFASPPVVRLGEGNIAVISNGFGRTMNTLEHFQLRGGSVAAFVNIQGNGDIGPETSAPDIQHDSSLPRIAWTDGALFHEAGPTDGGDHQTILGSDAREQGHELDAFSLKRQLCQALHALERLREVKVIFINWHSSQLPCRILADALVEYQRQLAHKVRRSSQPLSLVVRLAGEGAAGGYQRLMGEEIETEVNLEGAIARSMGLARMGRSSMENH